jgi:hypothetical protein
VSTGLGLLGCVRYRYVVIQSKFPNLNLDISWESVCRLAEQEALFNSRHAFAFVDEVGMGQGNL